jgi:hypothetical protein
LYAVSNSLYLNAPALKPSIYSVVQVEDLKAKSSQQQQRIGLLEAESKRQGEDIEFQDDEMVSLKQALAMQVDELVRLPPRRVLDFFSFCLIAWFSKE